MSYTGMLGQYAGFVTRLVAFVIDALIVIASISIINGALTLMLGFFGIDVAGCLADATQFAGLSLLCWIVNLVIVGVSLLFSPVYFIFFWTLAGQTPGKAIMGIRVVRLDGQKVSLWTALVRYIGYFVSFFLAGIGFLWVLIDDRRQGFHDKLAKTSVLYAWDAEQNELLVARVEGRLRGGDASASLEAMWTNDFEIGKKYDLLMVLADNFRKVRSSFNALQRAMNEGSFTVNKGGLYVKDLQGELVPLAGRDLAIEDTYLAVLDQGKHWGIPPDIQQEIESEVPPSGFVMVIILERPSADIAYQILESQRVSVSRYPLDLNALIAIEDSQSAVPWEQPPQVFTSGVPG
ncbi:MAG: RDD family protein [Chloroflexota bacterium]|nr:RDD family protein [Chloroflexota bacterium]